MNPQSTETVRPPTTCKATVDAPATCPPHRRTPKFWLYTVPALCLALFAGLVLLAVESRARVQAELAPVPRGRRCIPVAVVQPTTFRRRPER